MIKNLKMNVALALGTLVLGASAALAQGAPLSLRSTDGRTVNLADLKGKIVVLSFGGTWIPTAQKELPALQKLADRYSSRGVQVFWVSINSTKPGARSYATDEEVQAFAQKNNLRVTVLRDPERTAYGQFGLDAIPAIVILDREGKLARKHTGFGAEQGDGYGDVIRELDQLLK